MANRYKLDIFPEMYTNPLTKVRENQGGQSQGLFSELLQPAPRSFLDSTVANIMGRGDPNAALRKEYQSATNPERIKILNRLATTPKQQLVVNQMQKDLDQQQRTDQARTVSESLKAAAVKKAVDNKDPNAVTLLQNLDPIQDIEIFKQYMAKGTLQTGTKENIISSTSLMKAGYTPESVTAYAKSGGDASLLKKGPEEIGEEGSSEHKARRQDLDDHSSSLQDLNDVGTLISMLEGNPDMLSGTASDLRKAYTEMTGGQDINDAIRMYVERIKNQQVIAALPPGVATDTDVAIASKGQPLANASPEYLLKWARGVQKILWYEGRYLDARLRYQDKHASLRGFHTEYRDKTAKELEKEFKANFGESETFQGTDKIKQKTITYSALP